MKLFFVDVETTGLDPATHGLWQLSCQLWEDGREVDRVTLEAQPVKGKMVSQDALDKSKTSVAKLRELPQPFAQLARLKRVLGSWIDKFDKKDKAWFVGYNGNFDASFVRRWFEDHGDAYFGSWFWYPVIDVAVVAGAVLMKERGLLENFRLGTVCRHLGLDFDEDEAHDAQYDVDKTRQAFELLAARGLAPLGAAPARQ